MSILAKLLQKKQEDNPETGQIPPGLLQAVARSGARNGGRKRSLYLLIVCGGLASVLAGFFVMDYLQKHTPITPTARPAPPLPVAAAETVTAIQSAVSSPRILQTTASQPAPDATVRRKPGKPVAPVVSRTKTVPVARVTKPAKRLASSQQTEKKVPASAGVKTLKKDRLTVDAYLFAARNAEARREYVLALRQYLKAQEADPTNYRIMNNVASAFLQLGLPDEALGFAVKALGQKRDYVSALVNAGIAHGKLGNNPASCSMLARAVSLEPTNSPALFNLALSQERGGMVDEAITTYRRLADGGNSQGLLGMARIQEKKGNKDEALRLYRDVLALPEGGSAAREVARNRISLLE